MRLAFERVRKAMTDAGYAASQYTNLVQTYWTPIPRARLPLRRDGLTAPVRRRLWRLGPRCELGARHGGGGHERQRPHRRRPGRRRRARPPERARRAAPVRDGGGRARGGGRAELDKPGRGGPDGVGRADPHRHDDLRALPAAGGQPRGLLGPARRCATASGRPTTAARSAAGAACASPTASPRAGSRRWGCSRVSAAGRAPPPGEARTGVRTFGVQPLPGQGAMAPGQRPTEKDLPRWAPLGLPPSRWTTTISRPMRRPSASCTRPAGACRTSPAARCAPHWRTPWSA